jgi:hypothetical protein
MYSKASVASSAHPENEQLRKIETFKENHAAKNIQKEWRGYQKKKHDAEEVRFVLYVVLLVMLPYATLTEQ